MIYAVFGILIGLVIASRYRTRKKSELLYIGISLSFASVPYIGSGISLFMVIFLDRFLNDSISLFISYGFNGFAIIAWVSGISILLAPNSRKRNTIIFALICLPYEIFLIIALMIDPGLVGTRESTFSMDPTLIVTLFTIFVLITILVTMGLFIRECSRASDLKVRWKGRLLLVATLLLVIGSFIDVITEPTLITILIGRSILLARLVFSYFGWLMPNIVANWLIKDKE